MNHILKHYCDVVEFLGQVLNENYEILLHDFSNLESSIIAIENGHVSGRKIGAPLNATWVKYLKQGKIKNKEAYIKQVEHKSGTIVSAMFILDDNQTPIGMLGINYKCKPARDLIKDLEKALGLNTGNSPKSEFNLEDGMPKSPRNPQEVVDNLINEVIDNLSIDIERLSQEEKIGIVKELNEKGVFLIKGSINRVAEVLATSESSIYRYLSKSQ